MSKVLVFCERCLMDTIYSQTPSIKTIQLKKRMLKWLQLYVVSPVLDTYEEMLMICNY